jgi:type IV pilus assembly protein PilW
MNSKIHARGFTLIELMVSVTIALFLVGGALAIVAKTKNTFAAQNQMAQLQDNERLVMTFMAQVVQSAGYFPSPATNSSNLTLIFPVAGVFTQVQQTVFGTYSATGQGDTVSIRFAAGLTGGVADNVYGCTGQQNTTVAGYDTFTNKFYVDASNRLRCVFTNAAGTTDVPLATGVTKLVILYGVTRNTTATGSCADTYLNANQMAAADWLAVCTVSVTAWFTNPISTATPTLQVQRVIAVMNKDG